MAYDYSKLMGKEVRLDRGGPESRLGRVVASGEDYVVIYNEKDGLIYYNTQHLKSLTINTKDGMQFSETAEEYPASLEIIEADNFAELLKNFKHLWCQVNRGGPESVQGVLADVDDNSITMVVNHELVTMFLFHIKSVSYGVKKENKEDKKEENKEQKQDSSKQGDDSKS